MLDKIYTDIMMGADLAHAVLNMDDHGHSESLGPSTVARSEAWNDLVLKAEKAADRQTDEHRCPHPRRKPC